MGSFDTLRASERLEAAGLPPGQARAIATVFGDAQADDLTRQDLEIALAPLRTDLLLLRWSTGLIVGGTIALLLKAFA
ncbi:MAG TPA: DUF1640 domain-containing protein [Casimicrobiaceae bacterium]|nr:DUF1640 domain-containing protein [Casimicrobiaceae bacterium]